ncbi:hypothetical protein HDU76_008031 [Blyttiomyces sp. JEL0837]|nr:hypothetical protein HDU76_008031 [Blyttiomyces sp. JEL0837]
MAYNYNYTNGGGGYDTNYNNNYNNQANYNYNYNDNGYQQYYTNQDYYNNGGYSNAPAPVDVNIYDHQQYSSAPKSPNKPQSPRSQSLGQSQRQYGDEYGSGGRYNQESTSPSSKYPTRQGSRAGAVSKKSHHNTRSHSKPSSSSNNNNFPSLLRTQHQPRQPRNPDARKSYFKLPEQLEHLQHSGEVTLSRMKHAISNTATRGAAALSQTAERARSRSRSGSVVSMLPSFRKVGNSEEKDDDLKEKKVAFKDDWMAKDEGQEEGGKKKYTGFMKYLCCCIPTSKIGRIICGSVTFVVLVVLGVLGFLFWPRFPTIHVDSIMLNQTVGSFAFNIPKDGNLNYMNLSLSFNMIVSTFNPNRYDLHVDMIDLQANMQVNKSQIAINEKPAGLGFGTFIGKPPTPPPGYVPSYSPQIGSANKSTVIFRAGKNTTYQMIFNLYYKPDPNLGLLQDPVFQELCNVCGITSSPRTSKISYVAKSMVSFLKGLGYEPTVQGDLNINCPASPDQVQAIGIAVLSGMSVQDALNDVFGNGMGNAGAGNGNAGAGQAAPVAAPAASKSKTKTKTKTAGNVGAVTSTIVMTVATVTVTAAA